MNKKYTPPTSFYGVLISIISIVLFLFFPRRNDLPSRSQAQERLIKEFHVDLGNRYYSPRVLAAISAWRHRRGYRGTKSARYLPQNSNPRRDHRGYWLRLGRSKIVFVIATANFCPFLPSSLARNRYKAVNLSFFFFFMFSINYHPCVNPRLNHPAYLYPIPFIRT